MPARFNCLRAALWTAFTSASVIAGPVDENEMAPYTQQMVASLPKSPHGSFRGRILTSRNMYGKRRLAQSTGTNSVLVVRVSGNGGSETTSTLPEIRNNLFEGSPSVNSQYTECSDGALSLVPGDEVEITLPYSVNGRATDTDESFLEDMRQLAEAELGTAVPGGFDHVMYCLPDGTTVGGDPGWVGFAELGGVNSYYADGRCEQILTVMHEIGHNCKSPCVG